MTRKHQTNLAHMVSNQVCNLFIGFGSCFLGSVNCVFYVLGLFLVRSSRVLLWCDLCTFNTVPLCNLPQLVVCVSVGESPGPGRDFFPDQALLQVRSSTCESHLLFADFVPTFLLSSSHLHLSLLVGSSFFLLVGSLGLFWTRSLVLFWFCSLWFVRLLLPYFFLLARPNYKGEVSGRKSRLCYMREVLGCYINQLVLNNN